MVSAGALLRPFRQRTATTATGANARSERPANSLFQQPWWLDAVAPGAWDEVTVERDGATVARLPYVVRGPRRFRVLTQPPLTATLGPWVARTPGASTAKAMSTEVELLAELEAALPPAIAFRQYFSPTLMNALPFHWAGYRLEVRYTYRLEGTGSEDELWAGLAGSVRGNVRRARKVLEIRDDLDLDRFCAVWAKTYERQGVRPPDRRVLERIEAACAPRGARVMLSAHDEADRIHAVSYVVLDQHAAYYLIGGADPELRGSGAQSLLMWEAILRSRAVTDVFDFEGSMMRHVERFFRNFGGRQAPYLYVSRAAPPARMALALREAAQGLVARRRHIARRSVTTAGGGR